MKQASQTHKQKYTVVIYIWSGLAVRLVSLKKQAENHENQEKHLQMASKNTLITNILNLRKETSNLGHTCNWCGSALHSSSSQSYHCSCDSQAHLRGPDVSQAPGQFGNTQELMLWTTPCPTNATPVWLAFNSMPRIMLLYDQHNIHLGFLLHKKPPFLKVHAPTLRLIQSLMSCSPYWATWGDMHAFANDHQFYFFIIRCKGFVVVFKLKDAFPKIPWPCTLISYDSST